MRFTLQLVIHGDDDHETTVENVIVLEKQAERIEPLGLTLVEAMQLRTQLQQQRPCRPAAQFLSTTAVIFASVLRLGGSS